MVMMREEH